MAEETAPEVVDPNTPAAAATVDMDVESGAEPDQKREREEEGSEDGVVAKKQKVEEDKSVEEQRLEKVEGIGEEQEVEEKQEEAEKEGSVPDSIKLGFKSFASSSEMFHYFFNFLHAWPQSININKYEHMMLLELLKKGHAEADRKIGGGIRAFQVRKHPAFSSRCFFLIREDGSTDDFSFRKCVDHILPLPEDLHVKSEANKARGGGGGGGKHHGGKGGRGRGGRGGGHGHGRGGKGRY